MRGRDSFEAITKRSYRQAIVRMLESEYKIPGQSPGLGAAG